MIAALNVMKNMEADKDAKRIAVLGDMRELGINSCEYHISVGKHAAKCSDMLFTLGNEAKNIALGARSCGMDDETITVNLDCESYLATASELADVLRKGDVLLVKASRAVRAERVIDALKDILKDRR
jgi:UDP-N-acetylmuramoyl-tripeptide--D-alanyl-D-alanine ligase